ncbi:hypothetical protein Q8A64_13865 [Oxalobacteraceae bacterium R-40]|uniref:Uncharacterized protein n=1 Tax=Keguizhuia sedimenti TaxID=3064264 RepID=A0ABU1BR47_9BURK|nr:hypothetical protein [Oxalobacteraceae bacterium R-40]
MQKGNSFVQKTVWLRWVAVCTVGAAALAVLLNYMFLFRATTAHDKPISLAHVGSHLQPAETFKPINSAAAETGTGQALKSETSDSLNASSRSSMKPGKAEQLVKKRRAELERARADYLRIQRQIAEEYLGAEEGERARGRVLKASEALAAAQAQLDDSFTSGTYPSGNRHAAIQNLRTVIDDKRNRAK